MKRGETNNLFFTLIILIIIGTFVFNILGENTTGESVRTRTRVSTAPQSSIEQEAQTLQGILQARERNNQPTTIIIQTGTYRTENSRRVIALQQEREYTSTTANGWKPINNLIKTLLRTSTNRPFRIRIQQIPADYLITRPAGTTIPIQPGFMTGTLNPDGTITQPTTKTCSISCICKTCINVEVTCEDGGANGKRQGEIAGGESCQSCKINGPHTFEVACEDIRTTAAQIDTCTAKCSAYPSQPSTPTKASCEEQGVCAENGGVYEMDPPSQPVTTGGPYISR
ncbi:MAG TPA: hypothetical protein VJB87_05705 [Candidatus Nanoarchaeia archaeon]|nr:hypothetical protein [Candidatus Nanoarchaeia archaeon]